MDYSFTFQVMKPLTASLCSGLIRSSRYLAFTMAIETKSRTFTVWTSLFFVLGCA